MKGGVLAKCWVIIAGAGGCTGEIGLSGGSGAGLPVCWLGPELGEKGLGVWLLGRRWGRVALGGLQEGAGVS